MEKPDYWASDFDQQSKEVMYRMDVQSQLGLSALKSMILVNGGSIIGLLTFVGNKGHVADSSFLKCGVGLFGLGLFLALIAHFFAYFSQAEFMMTTYYRLKNAQSRMIEAGGIEEPQKHTVQGTRTLWGAIVTLFLSLGCFGCGVLMTLNGIL
ncbi:hypothetical protein [Novosphingobium rosa]|uniref:hypothetical protein n=1 Tax=Novosphingobium rosa TaxID=76978 RepID=UPI00082AACE5|nr:hypothetical protein [Novosphingobium rosa]